MRLDWDRRKQSVKLILLGSDYNRLQEGDRRCYVRRMSPQIRRLSQPGFNPASMILKKLVRTNQIYFDFNAITDSFRYILRDHGGYIAEGMIPASRVDAFRKGVNSLDDDVVRAQLLEIITQKGELPENPFIEAALNAGYRVDVDSVDRYQHDTPSESRTWGRVDRIKMNLRPREGEPQDQKRLNAFRKKWHDDVESYAAVIFVNADGDGFLDPLFFSLYNNYESCKNVFFADWCTCCTEPSMTQRAIDSDAEFAYQMIAAGRAPWTPCGRAQRGNPGKILSDLRLFFERIDHGIETSLSPVSLISHHETAGVGAQNSPSPAKRNIDFCTRVLGKCDFAIYFSLIAEKSAELNKKAMTDQRYQEAARVASTLLNRLDNAKNAFLISKRADIFKASCLSAIDEAMPVLRQHRGWKQVLADLFSALVSLLTLGVTNLVTGRFRLFPVKTDSEKKVELMADALQRVRVSHAV